jgi:hypothetical protein
MKPPTVQLFLSVFLSVLLSACAAPHYRPADLANRNAKEVKGVVATQGRAIFMLTEDGGETNKYCTGEMTEYLPSGFRSQEGDQVRVVFVESWEKNGKLKRTVLQLEALGVAPGNEGLTEITGELISIGYGSFLYGKRVMVRQEGAQEAMVVYVKSSSPVAPLLESRRDLVGRKIKIELQRVPIYRGNGYVYEAAQLQIVE